jgi:hypothetical protein
MNGNEDVPPKEEEEDITYERLAEELSERLDALDATVAELSEKLSALDVTLAALATHGHDTTHSHEEYSPTSHKHAAHHRDREPNSQHVYFRHVGK